jgi:alpha-tubulin suppressor-like RCC1 family protein
LEVEAGKVEQIRIKNLKCGSLHCMANLNIGSVLQWGGNSSGQLGNRKNTFSENPIWIKDLADENVREIFCGYNSSGMVCENSPSKEVEVKVGEGSEEGLEVKVGDKESNV